MKTILVTAYAIDPGKGSESGMGWNFVSQIARFNNVIAVTRENNEPAILEYISLHPEQQELFDRIRFIYFDWPWLFRCWKKGPLLSMIYFYSWQLSLAIWLFFKRFPVDIVHNLNFHNDWTPSFLWVLGKPFIWGPVGHHPKIPRSWLLPVYGLRQYLKDRSLWVIKRCCWSTDPFLKIAVGRARLILCMNSEAAAALDLRKDKFVIMPSVAAKDPAGAGRAKRPGFTVLSAGRFVPLKGFDLAVRSFAGFYHGLPAGQQPLTRLVLAGAGPQSSLIRQMIKDEGIEKAVTVVEWMPREELMALYESVDVFLFPSHEGAGMVVAEAMSYGLPVVCLDNAGPGEFIHADSTLGVCYTDYEHCIAELAKRLNALYREPGFYRRESDLALRQFRERFTWNHRGDQLNEIYKSL